MAKTSLKVKNQRKPKYTGNDTSDGGEHYICGKCKKENTLNNQKRARPAFLF